MAAFVIMDTPSPASAAAAVVALKSLTFAKSRFTGLPAPLRRRLAWCMAYDTLAALTGAASEVVVVSGQPALAARLRPLGRKVWVLADEPASGLNEAFQRGARELKSRGWGTVLACVGDLPALRPADVASALEAAAEHARCYLADHSGVGTTMLIASSAPLDPHFGGRSAGAHERSGAIALHDDSRPYQLQAARRDVDTEVDLAEAVQLGVGPATRSLWDPTSARLGDYQVITTTRLRADDATVVITDHGTRAQLSDAALAPPLRTVREGQRLHAALAGQQVLSAWL